MLEPSDGKLVSPLLRSPVCGGDGCVAGGDVHVPLAGATKLPLLLPLVAGDGNGGGGAWYFTVDG